MPKKLAVIIPFFQRETDILTRALESVFNQNDLPNIEIIIIDDGSPVSAKEETRFVHPPDHISLTFLEQKNAGPGAARNAGLEAVSDDTSYIAFLDSDDTWSANHLKSAFDALNKGYDFYFSNYLELGAAVSAFERNKTPDVERHKVVPELPNVRAFDGDLLQHQIVAPVIHTPTVVFRKSAFPNVRFSEQLRHGREDSLCWLHIASSRPRAVFSTDVECTAGEGSHVFQGTHWGTARGVKAYYCERFYLRAIKRKYTLDGDTLSYIKREEITVRRNIATTILHLAARSKMPPFVYLYRYFFLDPWIIGSLLTIGLNKVLRLK